MPFIYSPEQREEAKRKVIDGLRRGRPLTVICADEGMPSDDTIRDWGAEDAEFGRDIARARETGFDVIALEALAIADETAFDTKEGKDGALQPNSEWITRSRLRVDTRLKLLAKWDPKRYGDRTLIGSDPENPLPPGFSVNLVKAGAPD